MGTKWLFAILKGFGHVRETPLAYPRAAACTFETGPILQNHLWIFSSTTPNIHRTTKLYLTAYNPLTSIYRQIYTRTNYYKCSFYPLAVDHWNNLPPTTANFKQLSVRCAISNHKHHNCFYPRFSFFLYNTHTMRFYSFLTIRPVFSNPFFYRMLRGFRHIILSWGCMPYWETDTCACQVKKVSSSILKFSNAHYPAHTQSTSGFDLWGGTGRGGNGENCGTDVRASISKPTPFRYLAF